MYLYTFIAPPLAISLTAGFLFVTDASIAAKIIVTGFPVLSFFIQGPSLLWGLAGTLLQVVLCIGVLIYFKVAR